MCLGNPTSAALYMTASRLILLDPKLCEKSLSKFHCQIQGIMVMSLVFTVKPVLSGHTKRRPKIGFQDRFSLNAGQKYCRMLQESILQYFRTLFSHHLSLRPLFWLFLSGCLRQVLLYAAVQYGLFSLA